MAPIKIHHSTRRPESADCLLVGCLCACQWHCTAITAQGLVLRSAALGCDQTDVLSGGMRDKVLGCAGAHEGDRKVDEAGGQGGEAPLQAASPLSVLQSPQQALQHSHHPCPPQVNSRHCFHKAPLPLNAAAPSPTPAGCGTQSLMDWMVNNLQRLEELYLF